MSRRRPLESRFAALRPSCRGGGQPARPRGQEDILIGLHWLAAARARRDACDTALGLGSPGLAGSGASLSPHSLSAAPPLRSGPGGVSSRAGPPAGHPASLPRPGSENLISPLGRVSGAGACFLTKPKERPLMGAASWASPVRRCRCLYLGSGSFGRPGGSQCTPHSVRQEGCHSLFSAPCPLSLPPNSLSISNELSFPRQITVCHF